MSTVEIILLAICVFLILVVAFEKKSNVEVTKLMVSRNVELGLQLDVLRQEISNLNKELIELVRENHILNMEVQILATEVAKLRTEIEKQQTQQTV